VRLGLETIRGFIAVPISDEVRDQVRAAVDRLRAAEADVKWVEPENLHITLKFLGNIALGDVEHLGRTLRDGLRDIGPFEITMSGLGCFPKGRRAPRVLWVGLDQGADHLSEVAAKVEQACSEMGFESEARPFRAHLTVGRVRRGSPNLGRLAELVVASEFKPLKLRVDRVNLVRSRLSPQGPTYTILESIALKDG
jgi:2'-5' RNA ligase